MQLKTIQTTDENKAKANTHTPKIRQNAAQHAAIQTIQWLRTEQQQT